MQFEGKYTQVIFNISLDENELELLADTIEAHIHEQYGPWRQECTTVPYPLGKLLEDLKAIQQK